MTQHQTSPCECCFSLSGRPAMSCDVIPLPQPDHNTDAWFSTVKGPQELRLTVTIAPSKTVLQLKEAIAAQSDVEKDKQRLIYSGEPLSRSDRARVWISG